MRFSLVTYAQQHYKAWIFPVMLLVSVAILSTLQVSGTSLGVYDVFFGEQNPRQIHGQPRPVRSDEWAVTTPFTAAQFIDHFPTHNHDISGGQNMSLVVDVPYADWSALFKPQNLGFFILPLETALALKWWLIAAGLALAVYVFVLHLYPKRYVMASLLGFIMLFSPFIQWWYQAITILPITYGLLGAVILDKLLHSKRLAHTILWGVLLTYIATCFALLMYPAFQIIVGLVVVGLIIAILWARKEFHLLWQRRNLITLCTVFVATAIIVGVFLWQNFTDIQAVLHTVYPGSRKVMSGGFDIFRLMSWPLSYLMLDDSFATIFNANQSESSNFILIGFVILPFLLYATFKKRSSMGRLEKSILVACSIITIIIAIRMFIPLGSELFSLIGLSKVPHVRLFEGLGIINIALLAVAVGRPGDHSSSWKSLINLRHLAYFCSLSLIYGLLVYATIRHYAINVVGIKEAAAIVLLFSFVSTCLLSSYRIVRLAGLIGVVLIGVFSSYSVHPLYRGINITTNDFGRYIQKVEARDDAFWIAQDSPQISSMLVANGAEVYGGVNTYPQLHIWQRYFPGKDKIFNRYAHVRFRLNPAIKTRSLSLIQSDSFFVDISPCDTMFKELNIRHIVSEKPLSAPCFSSQEHITFEKKLLHIYTIN